MAQFIPFGKIVNHYKFQNELVLQHIPVRTKQLSKIKFIFVRLQQQYIPYEVLQIHNRHDTESTIFLEGVNNFEEAKLFLKKEVFIESDIAKLIITTVEIPFVGYTITDSNNTTIGTIVHTEEISGQVLASVMIHHKEVFIPLHERLIIAIHKKTKTIKMEIPDGLLDLQ